MYNLHETGHEAGIIIYGDGCVAVFNWAAIDDNSLPMIFGDAGPVSFHEDMNWAKIEKVKDCEDVRRYLPGQIWMTEDDEPDTDMHILWDENGDLPSMFGIGLGAIVYKNSPTPHPYSGTIWELGDLRIITLDIWN